jgi:hypothetical protein
MHEIQLKMKMKTLTLSLCCVIEGVCILVAVLIDSSTLTWSKFHHHQLLILSLLICWSRKRYRSLLKISIIHCLLENHLCFILGLILSFWFSIFFFFLKYLIDFVDFNISRYEWWVLLLWYIVNFGCWFVFNDSLVLLCHFFCSGFLFFFFHGYCWYQRELVEFKDFFGTLVGNLV